MYCMSTSYSCSYTVNLHVVMKSGTKNLLSSDLTPLHQQFCNLTPDISGGNGGGSSLNWKKVPAGTRIDSLSDIWSYVTLSAARQSDTFSHQGESTQMLE